MNYSMLLGAFALVLITCVFVDFGWRAPYWICSAFGAQFCLTLWAMGEMSRLQHERELRALERHEQIMKRIGWLSEG